MNNKVSSTLQSQKWNDIDPRFLDDVGKFIYDAFGTREDLSRFYSFNKRETREFSEGKLRGIILLESKDNSCGYALTGPGAYSAPVFISEVRQTLRGLFPVQQLCLKSDEELRIRHIEGNLTYLGKALKERIPNLEFVRKVIDYQNDFGGLSWNTKTR